MVTCDYLCCNDFNFEILTFIKITHLSAINNNIDIQLYHIYKVRCMNVSYFAS